MVWCARNNVSDIHLQGDNHFVVGRYGRLVFVLSVTKPARDSSRRSRSPVVSLLLSPVTVCWRSGGTRTL
jgi:hypothetical protein